MRYDCVQLNSCLGIEKRSASDNYGYHKYLYIFQYITMLLYYNTIYILFRVYLFANPMNIPFLIYNL